MSHSPHSAAAAPAAAPGATLRSLTLASTKRREHTHALERAPIRNHRDDASARASAEATRERRRKSTGTAGTAAAAAAAAAERGRSRRDGDRDDGQQRKSSCSSNGQWSKTHTCSPSLSPLSRPARVHTHTRTHTHMRSSAPVSRPLRTAGQGRRSGQHVGEGEECTLPRAFLVATCSPSFPPLPFLCASLALHHTRTHTLARTHTHEPSVPAPRVLRLPQEDTARGARHRKRASRTHPRSPFAPTPPPAARLPL